MKNKMLFVLIVILLSPVYVYAFISDIAGFLIELIWAIPLAIIVGIIALVGFVKEKINARS